jgi:ribosomal protein S27AE
MRFPTPVTEACERCGRPTVLAEMWHGLLRVHCGTWRHQCERNTDMKRVNQR